jgi:hypothetical protein
MTVLERKAKFTKESDVLFSVIPKQKVPCQYSIEELNRRAEQGIIDAGNGLGKSLDDLRKKHPYV